MRKLLKKELFQSQFEDLGYIIIDLNNPNIIDLIDKEYHQLNPDDNFNPNDGRYHCTFIDTNIQYKKKAFELFKNHITPIIKEHLIDYDLLAGNFYVKPKNACEFEVHQNWSVVDETKHTTVTIWIPMQDTNEFNGTLEVIPGSHKISKNITCLHEPYFFDKFETELKRKYFQTINLKKGQAIIFDDKLVHYSKTNQSSKSRRALQLIAVPKEAELLIHFIDKDDSNYYNIFETNSEFYLQHNISHFMDGKPPLKHVGRVPNKNVLYTEEEFVEALKRGNKFRKDLYSKDSIKTTDLTFME
ncbi:MAG: hypothetical protein COA67_00665 [Lutibacter sp.]|nr:MAG: hypothetical protein COA67_00665 [Lutibacter sp.]